MKITIDTDKITHRLSQLTGLQTKQQVARKVEAAYDAGFSDGNDEPASGELRSYGYRSTKASKRDTGLSPDKMLSTAWSLYQSNQAAGRYLEITRDYVIGKGLKPVIEDDDLAEIIDTFIERNDLQEQLPKFALQLRLFGEQCFPVYVRQSDGQVTLAYIDPAEIEEVRCHPDNALKPWAVILKSETGNKRRVYRIIRKDEGFVFNDMVFTPNYPDKMVTHDQARLEPWELGLLAKHGLAEYTGSCFHYGANNVSNQMRGFSDLVRPADSLDLEDETIFALGEREAMAAYFAWVVTLDGAPQEEVDRRSSDIAKRVPKKGQTIVKNDKEHWEMAAPDIKQQGSIATADAILDRAWGLLGMPKTWRGVGEDSNRASATVMGEPTRKTLEHKQSIVKKMYLDFLAFVRDQAEIAGYWAGAERTIDATVPEIGERDYNAAAVTLDKVLDGVTKARDEKLLSRETAAKIVARIITDGFGVEFDISEELEAVDEEQAERQSSLPNNGLPVQLPMFGGDNTTMSHPALSGVSVNGN